MDSGQLSANLLKWVSSFGLSSFETAVFLAAFNVAFFLAAFNAAYLYGDWVIRALGLVILFPPTLKLKC